MDETKGLMLALASVGSGVNRSGDEIRRRDDGGMLTTARGREKYVKELDGKGHTEKRGRGKEEEEEEEAEKFQCGEDRARERVPRVAPATQGRFYYEVGAPPTLDRLESRPRRASGPSSTTLAFPLLYLHVPALYPHLPSATDTSHATNVSSIAAIDLFRFFFFPRVLVNSSSGNEFSNDRARARYLACRGGERKSAFLVFIFFEVLRVWWCRVIRDPAAAMHSYGNAEGHFQASLRS